MSIALVQSFYGANGSSGGSQTTPFTVTVNANIPSNISAGDLIVVVAAYKITRSGTGSIQTPIVLPTAPGDGGTGNWRNPISNTFPVTSVTSSQGFALSYLQNCPAVSAGSTISVAFNFGGSGITENAIDCEFAVTRGFVRKCFKIRCWDPQFLSITVSTRGTNPVT